MDSRTYPVVIPGHSTGKAASHRIDKVRAHLALRGSWLDFGCGPGDYSILLSERGCDRVTGVDVREDIVWQERASTKLGFLCLTSPNLPFPAQTFDGVWMNEVLEHVEDEHTALVEARRVLTSTGHLVVFSPNRWFPFEGHGAVICGRQIDHPVPLLPWVPEQLARRWMRPQLLAVPTPTFGDRCGIPHQGARVRVPAISGISLAPIEGGKAGKGSCPTV